MKKRIKKKKAKQAELIRQQELTEYMEQIGYTQEDIIKISRSFGIAISNMFRELAAAFMNMSIAARNWSEQFGEENSNYKQTRLS